MILLQYEGTWKEQDKGIGKEEVWRRLKVLQ